MKWIPHDLGTWGFILSVAASVLMYPVGLFINLTTPLVKDWLSTWNAASLSRRIAKLEAQLAELEKNPPIEEVQDAILWGIKKIRIMVLSATASIVLIVYAAVLTIADENSQKFKQFGVLCGILLVINFFNICVLRYCADFRSKRSPRRRARLRKAIADLKAIQAS